MGVVLVVSGLCWAMVGVAHLVRLSRMTGASAPSDGMAAFGSFLDVAALSFLASSWRSWGWSFSGARNGRSGARQGRRRREP